MSIREVSICSNILPPSILSSRFLDLKYTRRDQNEPYEADIIGLFFIKGNTTPEQFDKQRKRYPDCKLNSRGWSDWTRLGGFDPLQLAVLRKNIPLTKHIVALGKKEGYDLLQFGNALGTTPLLRITTVLDSYSMAKTLIELGSPINIQTNFLATPLGYALENRQRFDANGLRVGGGPNLPIAKLLLRHGGVVGPGRLTLFGIKALMQACKEIREEDARFNSNLVSITKGKLPSELAKIVADYAVVEPDQACEEYSSKEFLGPEEMDGDSQEVISVITENTPLPNQVAQLILGYAPVEKGQVCEEMDLNAFLTQDSNVQPGSGLLQRLRAIGKNGYEAVSQG